MTAVTVNPSYRRQGLARILMDYLETVTNRDRGFFVDLFVRASNKVAITFYQTLGYSIYRTVKGYYSGESESDSEDALDMRKSMKLDPKQECIIAEKKEIAPHELEFH